jgi:RHS repeat-associated protein
VTTAATGGLNGDGAGVTRFLFAGEYQDDSGLYYLRARFYDPVTASFLSVDPALSVTGSPYAYAAGNPLQMVDPLGLCPWDNWTNSIKNTVRSLTNWENVGDVVGAVSCKVSGGFFGTMKTMYGGIASFGSWHWDRESTFLQYFGQAWLRRQQNPFQAAWDDMTLTSTAETFVAVSQIWGFDAELLNKGRCGSEAECFIGGWGATIQGGKSDGKSAAITIGHSVSIPDDVRVSTALINHEVAGHVNQYETYGGVSFVLIYFGDYFVRNNLQHDKNAYDNNKLEKEANLHGDP